MVVLDRMTSNPAKICKPGPDTHDLPICNEIMASTSADALKYGACHLNACASDQNSLKAQSIDKCPRSGASVKAVACLKSVEDFEILEVLGRGFFGVAYKVREKRTYDASLQPAILVMKEPIIQPAQSRLSAKKIVSDEYCMLLKLRHSNILKTRGICVQQQGTEWKLNLLVDFCDSGALQQLILNKSVNFDWLHRCQIAFDICKAMDFVHRKGFMHRDLTSMNILLQSQYRAPPKAVVADFGLSCKIPKKDEHKQQVGTQNWMAPEMLMEEYYDEKADVFSFGIIICQMIARIDADHDAGLYRTPMFGLDYVRFTAHCPSDTPLELLKTAFMCCLWNAESRPSFKQLRQIIDTDLPKWREAYEATDETRLGRSHSDAAIRSPGSQLMLNRRNLCEEPSIPEGVSITSNDVLMEDERSENGSVALTEADLDRRIKQLATNVANEDPDYQESSMNPFSKHARYRSMRKIKPGDFKFLHRPMPFKQTMKLNSSPEGDEEDDDDEKDNDLAEDDHDNDSLTGHGSTQVSSGGGSLPQLLFTVAPSPANRSPQTLKISKRSFTLGLGEQRDLQSRITMTFRDIDRKFTKTSSKSGILVSSRELDRLSMDSDKDLLLLDIERQTDDQLGSMTASVNSSMESFEPKRRKNGMSGVPERVEDQIFPTEEKSNRSLTSDLSINDFSDSVALDAIAIRNAPAKSKSLIFRKSRSPKATESSPKSVSRIRKVSNSTASCSIM